MSQFAKRIVDSKPFRAVIIAIILLAGVLAGVETSAAMRAQHGALLHALDVTVLAIFILEIVLKLVSHGRRPLDYFRDGWNVFDFTIVALCVLPVGGPFAAVLRLVRTLRLLRLVTALPKLQLLVGALIKSLSSMGYVGLLLSLIFYIYAVTGVHLFGQASPEYFGNLRAALLSLFQMITLDDWRTMYDSAQAAAPLAAAPYFVSFILLGTMIMLNLFIGIVMNSMAEMHTELDEQKQAAHPVPALVQLAAIERQLAGLRTTLSLDQTSRTRRAQTARSNSTMNAPFAETQTQTQTTKS
jgi:voltage-gated sodium channel